MNYLKSALPRMGYMANFGEWLKSERLSRGLTLEELAARSPIKTTAATISRFENEQRRVTPESAEYLAAALAGPEADAEEIERIYWKAWGALGSRGDKKIEYAPVDDPDFWDAYEGAPQEDQELAKQLLQRARDRERERTIGGKIAE